MKSFWAITALLIGLGASAGYAYSVSQGKVMGSPEKDFVPKEVRSKPDGYRSFHFWHVGYGGYRGGK